MKLKRLLDLIDRRTSWGKEQLKGEILALVAEDIELVYSETMSAEEAVREAIGRQGW